MPPYYSWSSPSVPDRFWRRVDDSAGPEGCWLWRGAIRNGYGVMSLGGRRVEYTHRVSWVLHGHELPPAPYVLRHSCDVRPCCNPAHLSVGTMADNHRDCIDRGRSAKPPGFGRGQRNSRARLRDADIEDIRYRFAGGERQAALAEAYGVTEAWIQQLIHRRRQPLPLPTDLFPR